VYSASQRFRPAHGESQAPDNRQPRIAWAPSRHTTKHLAPSQTLTPWSPRWASPTAGATA